MCGWAKSIKKKLLLFKVDFDKAFDSVNWDYLDSVLEQMGFGNKWRSWIRGCLSSSRASVLVNGAPTKEFRVTKGVRQGDPLSPFLFIIAMEGLNVALKTAVEKWIFKGVQLPNNGPTISHLFYADDALFVGEWCKSNIKCLVVRKHNNIKTVAATVWTTAPTPFPCQMKYLQLRGKWGVSVGLQRS